MGDLEGRGIKEGGRWRVIRDEGITLPVPEKREGWAPRGCESELSPYNLRAAPSGGSHLLKGGGQEGKQAWGWAGKGRGCSSLAALVH